MKREPFALDVGGIAIVGELFCPGIAVSAPALCICHGIPSGQPADPGDGGYPDLAARFCSAGFATVIFNFRGTGSSGGDFDMIGWTQDLQSVVRLLENHPAVDGARIYVMGFSGGAATTAYVAARDRRVARVVLCACPAEFRKLTGLHRDDFSLDHFRQIGLIRDNGFPPSHDEWLGSFKEVSPIRWVDRIAPRPLLILHGQDDDLVDVEQARRLYEKARQPKDIAVVEGAGHRLRLSQKAMSIALEWLLKA
ncbi:MAG: alpha/beta fold hydrolase [Chloroflexi bacterium]|nr:alpha/beta fold hydrolase [Chloroflexota bacterium]